MALSLPYIILICIVSVTVFSCLLLGFGYILRRLHFTILPTSSPKSPTLTALPETSTINISAPTEKPLPRPQVRMTKIIEPIVGQLPGMPPPPPLGSRSLTSKKRISKDTISRPEPVMSISAPGLGSGLVAPQLQLDTTVPAVGTMGYAISASTPIPMPLPSYANTPVSTISGRSGHRGGGDGGMSWSSTTPIVKEGVEMGYETRSPGVDSNRGFDIDPVMVVEMRGISREPSRYGRSEFGAEESRWDGEEMERSPSGAIRMPSGFEPVWRRETGDVRRQDLNGREEMLPGRRGTPAASLRGRKSADKIYSREPERYEEGYLPQPPMPRDERDRRYESRESLDRRYESRESLPRDHYEREDYGPSRRGTPGSVAMERRQYSRDHEDRYFERVEREEHYLPSRRGTPGNAAARTPVSAYDRDDREYPRASDVGQSRSYSNSRVDPDDRYIERVERVERVERDDYPPSRRGTPGNPTRTPVSAYERDEYSRRGTPATVQMDRRQNSRDMDDRYTERDSRPRGYSNPRDPRDEDYYLPEAHRTSHSRKNSYSSRHEPPRQNSYPRDDIERYAEPHYPSSSPHSSSNSRRGTPKLESSQYHVRQYSDPRDDDCDLPAPYTIPSRHNIPGPAFDREREYRPSPGPRYAGSQGSSRRASPGMEQTMSHSLSHRRNPSFNPTVQLPPVPGSSSSQIDPNTPGPYTPAYSTTSFRSKPTGLSIATPAAKDFLGKRQAVGSAGVKGDVRYSRDLDVEVELDFSDEEDEEAVVKRMGPQTAALHKAECMVEEMEAGFEMVSPNRRGTQTSSKSVRGRNEI